MSKLLAHFKRMQERAQHYLEPGNYVNLRGVESRGGIDDHPRFANDMVHLLDGPEQREAQEDAEWDYLAESEKTTSTIHGTKLDGRHQVSLHEMKGALVATVEAAERMDKLKKLLFRGRDREDMGFFPLAEGTPTVLHAVDATDIELLHGIVGLITEVGELAEALLTHIVDGDNSVIDKVNINEECGDLLWYMACLMRYTGSTFPDEMRRNIAKLRKRHGEQGFDAQRDANRDLGAEREVLEGAAPEEAVSDIYSKG